jgi:hypothetical protein
MVVEARCNPRREQMTIVLNSRAGNLSRDAKFRPGEIVMANIVNGIEIRHATGKFRPCVIVEAPEHGCLTVAGLTLRAITKKGDSRMEISDKQGCGLHGRSFLFGRHLTRVSRIDVGDHLGWLSAVDAVKLAHVYRLAANWMMIDDRAVA